MQLPVRMDRVGRLMGDEGGEQRQTEQTQEIQFKQ